MRPDKIIVHCSDSAWGHALIINKWHTDPPPQGRGWRAIGYHVVIQNGLPTADHVRKNETIRMLDGQVELGRPLDADEDLEAHEMGAHVYGFNRTTLAVCLIGTDTFTRNQIISLVKVVKWWQFQFRVKTKNVLGHYEMPTARGKTCPNLDMEKIRSLIHYKSEAMRGLNNIPNLKENLG
ncbi:MAG: N-acetylmuramoyl-L-alanine amidase [Candidatus Krumholzibacteriota bacterium]|nr:N-acetylmuramoyl-L-alanine amidase [Candidatus Krumholzibacteriota bacterium]